MFQTCFNTSRRLRVNTTAMLRVYLEADAKRVVQTKLGHKVCGVRPQRHRKQNSAGGGRRVGCVDVISARVPFFVSVETNSLTIVCTVSLQNNFTNTAKSRERVSYITPPNTCFCPNLFQLVCLPAKLIKPL